MQKEITFKTFVRINGVYYSEDDMSPEKIKYFVQKKHDEVLADFHYEKKNGSRVGVKQLKQSART